MRPDPRRLLAPLLAVALALTIALGTTSCRRADQGEVVDGVRYGVTKEPFRHRWWLYYERGVSWAEGGFYDRAEADLRTCLRLRQVDRRRARTYGMHFVQAFPRRELGAVLLAQGRLEEAEAALRESMRHEPSAKADALLVRIDERRGVVAAPDSDPVPTAAPDLIVDRVEPGPQDSLTYAGRMDAMIAQGLYVLRAAGDIAAVALDEAGAFVIELQPGDRLASGPPAAAAAAETMTPLLTAAPPPAEPELGNDLPEDGAVLFAPRLLVRFEARADTPLAGLSVRAGDAIIAERRLEGVQAAGMLDLRLPEGEQVVVVELRTADGRATRVERTIDVRPSPEHRPELRATAMLLPLQAPETGDPIEPADDPRLLSALSADGRFRLIERQADELLERELALVDAGYVDRVTAASAGRRLQARYVVAGTLRRGRNELECYLRLVHAETGRVVAIADAWVDRTALSDELPFFTLAAARLRQTFPVIAATVTADGEDLALDLGTEAGIAERMHFHLISAEPDLLDPQTGAVLLPGRRTAVGLLEVDEVERGRSTITVVRGETPAPGTEVVSE